jgi:hypothetical protein
MCLKYFFYFYFKLSTYLCTLYYNCIFDLQQNEAIILLPYIQLFAIRHIQSTDRKKGGWICRTGEVDGAMKFSAKGKPTERCQYGQEHADRT